MLISFVQILPKVSKKYIYSHFYPSCGQLYCQENAHEIEDTFELLFCFAIAAVLVQLVFLSLSRCFLNHISLGITGSAILGYQLSIPSVTVPIMVAVKYHRKPNLKCIELKIFGFVTKHINFT